MQLLMNFDFMKFKFNKNHKKTAQDGLGDILMMNIFKNLKRWI